MCVSLLMLSVLWRHVLTCCACVLCTVRKNTTNFPISQLSNSAHVLHFCEVCSLYDTVRISYYRPNVSTWKGLQKTAIGAYLGYYPNIFRNTLWNSFIHSFAVCLMTGPKPLPKQLSTQCDLELPPSNESILSFP